MPAPTCGESGPNMMIPHPTLVRTINKEQTKLLSSSTASCKLENSEQHLHIDVTGERYRCLSPAGSHLMRAQKARALVRSPTAFTDRPRIVLAECTVPSIWSRSWEISKFKTHSKLELVSKFNFNFKFKFKYRLPLGCLFFI